MLLTGFDSKFLNTLYVDKTLKHHGLIQAFSRTNRVLNDTKPHGHILDFRAQQTAVDEAINLFSGLGGGTDARKIWLVEPAKEVAKKLKDAVAALDTFLESQGLPPAPESVPALRGDEARAQFVKSFKEVQRLKTQLDQYIDLPDEDRAALDELLPPDTLNAYRGVYLSTAHDLKKLQDKKDDTPPPPVVEALDFEFVLFASAEIDYDYIMGLLARYSQQPPGPRTMSREQLIGLIQADAKFIDEREIITAYVNELRAGEGLDKAEITEGYQRFRESFHAAALARVAEKHRLPVERLQAFVDAILQRLVFDGEQLTVLLEPLDLNPGDVVDFEKQMRRKVHYVIRPDHLWANIANLARNDSAELLETLKAGFDYIENESFDSTFQGLFSEINLYSEKLGKTQPAKNKMLCGVVKEIAKGLNEFSTDIDALGDAYEYLIGQFAAGSGKKAGEFYTPQQISTILSRIVTLDSQEPKTGPVKHLGSVFDFACGSGSLLLNVRQQLKKQGGTIGKIHGQEKNITTYNLARMNMLLHGVKDTEFEIYHGDTLTNDWDLLRETNPAKMPKFDAIVANPPFSLRWDLTSDIFEVHHRRLLSKAKGTVKTNLTDLAVLCPNCHRAIHRTNPMLKVEALAKRLKSLR